ncbi:ThiF family adenylyltransferase [Microbacterium sp.]|uniref:ThiF family adenylyltransferase n=1 Tax=Microbacterium sp. TaxID=51671 RepID=UPI002D791E88|nr:ThiF family adenylyltransferase [Microbacterium sp.]HET6300381.1 ThiF family adenylyltransferase [Microbacterium sp.]
MSLPPLVEPVDALSDAERIRTARHRSLIPLGELGQRRLRAAHVAIMGAGGLGSPVVLALAAAGVGTLTVIDDDDVELTNLQRQVVHRLSDVGRPKVDSAVRAAADLSPETVVVPVRERLTRENGAELLRGADLVIDGTDTFETREAVAATTEELGIPLVWGTVQGFDAQVTVFWSQPPAGAAPVRLSDVYPPGSVGELPTCAMVGVLGALCMQVGSLLAIEAVKLITGVGEPLLGRMLVIDGLRGRQSEVAIRAATARATTPSATPATPAPIPHVDAIPAGTLVVDVREPHETALGTIPGARLIPLGELLEDPASLRGAPPVIVVCQAGVRARRAAQALREAGVEASVLSGGMDAWTSLERSTA